MFYFCIFYIIPCLVSGWLVNRRCSEGDVDYLTATAMMLTAIIPIFNIFLLINLIKYEIDNK